MAKKKGWFLKITSKSYPKIDIKKLAEALGAKIITDPKEIREFEKKYGLSHPFLPKPKK